MEKQEKLDWIQEEWTEFANNPITLYQSHKMLDDILQAEYLKLVTKLYHTFHELFHNHTTKKLFDESGFKKDFQQVIFCYSELVIFSDKMNHQYPEMPVLLDSQFRFQYYRLKEVYQNDEFGFWCKKKVKLM